MSTEARWSVETRNPAFHTYSQPPWRSMFTDEATAREIAERTARDTALGVRIVKMTREIVWTRPPPTPDSE